MSPGRHIRSMDELERAKGRWNDVYAHSRMKSPVLSFEYVKLWYECFSSSKDIRVFEVVEENKTIGFLPMVVKKNNGVRVLTNQTNDHCFHGEALVRQGYEEVFKKRVFDEILKESAWDILHHAFSYSFSDMYPLFSKPILAEGKRRWKMTVQPTYTVSLEKSFEEYFHKDLSSSLRKSLRLSKNRLKKARPHRFLHFEGDDALGNWELFLSIEGSGWKGKNGTSILKTRQEYRRYYDGLIRILAATHDLHLYFLELDQKFIASGFGYTAGDIFQWVKSGYDEECQALSPSNMLFIHLVEDLQEHHGEIKRIHLFPYDDTGYKKRFANEDQRFSETIIYNNTLTGQSVWMFDKLKERIKKHPRLAACTKKVMKFWPRYSFFRMHVVE